MGHPGHSIAIHSDAASNHIINTPAFKGLGYATQ